MIRTEYNRNERYTNPFLSLFSTFDLVSVFFDLDYIFFCYTLLHMRIIRAAKEKA